MPPGTHMRTQKKEKMENVKKRRPDYIAKTVAEEKEKTRWKDVGVGFQKNDTITILLDALPVNGKIVLMPPRE